MENAWIHWTASSMFNMLLLTCPGEPLLFASKRRPRFCSIGAGCGSENLRTIAEALHWLIEGLRQLHGKAEPMAEARFLVVLLVDRYDRRICVHNVGAGMRPNASLNADFRMSL